jgi:hypothetical protein
MSELQKLIAEIPEALLERSRAFHKRLSPRFVVDEPAEHYLFAALDAERRQDWQAMVINLTAAANNLNHEPWRTRLLALSPPWTACAPVDVVDKPASPHVARALGRGCESFIEDVSPLRMGQGDDPPDAVVRPMQLGGCTWEVWSGGQLMWTFTAYDFDAALVEKRRLCRGGGFRSGDARLLRRIS